MIDSKDLKIELERIYPGGQHAGTPPTNMIITHLPTGLQIKMPPMHRSQHRIRSVGIEAIEFILTHPDL